VIDLSPRPQNPDPVPEVPIAYLGRATWAVSGERGTWGESYRLLTDRYRMYHSQAVWALVEAVRVDRPAWR
jgi:hypothetical protein